MLTKQTIEQVVASQKERLQKMEPGLLRHLQGIENLSSHVLIITGIRRCGKSTLLQQINSAASQSSVYLNFEDPRLAGFDLNDFNRLHELTEKNGILTYYFDEVQLVDKWESFVRFRLDEGYRITITGSNATMMSKELGTKLTGRHISKELFPFSYNEYLAFTRQQQGPVSALGYMDDGGFPGYLKTGHAEVLMQTFNDIIIRDISLRYNIKNTLILQQLAIWLVSNCGKCLSGNRLRKLFDIASSSTIMEYLAYFNDAYLFFYVPRFSYSQKVQMVNPKKLYCIDNGFIKTNSISFSPDRGRLLENMVFLHLRRKNNAIFYFSEKNECDFVVFNGNHPVEIYQVCQELDQENLDREIKGLSEAMDFFNTGAGKIITSYQTDRLETGNKTILVQPFHEWATEQ